MGKCGIEQDSDQVVDRVVAVVVPVAAVQAPLRSSLLPIGCAHVLQGIAASPSSIATSVPSALDEHDFRAPVVVGPMVASTISASISSTTNIEESNRVDESSTGKENIPLELVPLVARKVSQAGQSIVPMNEDGNLQIDVSRNPLASLINGSFHKGVFNILVNYNNIYKKSKKKDRLVQK